MKTLLTVLFAFIFAFGYSQKNTAIFLHHSTGEDLYTQGKVSDWIKSYNSTNGTSFQIDIRTYPDTPYTWANYPYDYWKLWVNNTCDNSNPNIECLSSIASNYGLVIYKHCYPGAAIAPDTGYPNITSSRKSLENYKLQYRALRILMDGMPDKKFMVWTLVPLHRLATTAEEAARANEFVTWVKTQWLIEDGKQHPNIFIFDFYNLAAELDANPINGQQYCLKYIYEYSHTSNDSHPNTLANQTIGSYFAKAVVDALTTNYNISEISVSSQTGENSIFDYHGTLQMQTSILPVDALSKSVTWSVINLTGKATINSTGLLSAESNGTVKVVATANDSSGVTGELIITISNQIKLVESITISSPLGTQISTNKGNLQLEATILPAEANSKSVTWSVINQIGRATISDSGVLTAEKNGTVKVIATANDSSGVFGEIQINITNQIILLEKIDIIDNLASDTILGIGKNLELKVTTLPTDATNPTVVWSVKNISGIADINDKGVLVTKSPGLIRVIASALDGSSCFAQNEYQIVIPVSNEQNFSLQVVNLFPNPTENKFRIEAVKIPNDGFLVEIRDVKGVILVKKRIYEQNSVWTLEQYPIGIYFLIIKDSKNIWTKKIIKYAN